MPHLFNIVFIIPPKRSGSESSGENMGRTSVVRLLLFSLDTDNSEFLYSFKIKKK